MSLEILSKWNCYHLILFYEPGYLLANRDAISPPIENPKRESIKLTSSRKSTNEGDLLGDFQFLEQFFCLLQEHLGSALREWSV